MRTEEVVSASIWLAKVGRLTSTEKIKSDTAIERIVRIVLRLVRSRFLKISVRYFVIFPCSGYAEIWSAAVAFADTPPFPAPVNTPLSTRYTAQIGLTTSRAGESPRAYRVLVCRR